MPAIIATKAISSAAVLKKFIVISYLLVLFYYSICFADVNPLTAGSNGDLLLWLSATVSFWLLQPTGASIWPVEEFLDDWV